MLAAAALKGTKFSLALLRGETISSAREWLMLAVAALTAYLVSRVAIRFLLDFVRRRGFAAFGVYRILLGAVVLARFCA